MSSNQNEFVSAEQRFRKAFDRLKKNEPEILGQGTPVSQNNVAKEAGCDPSALRKSRFPALIREIQAYVEIHKTAEPSQRKEVLKKRSVRRSLQDRLHDALNQRDMAQSLVISANQRVLELTEKVHSLQQKLDEVLPPPTQFGKR